MFASDSRMSNFVFHDDSFANVNAAFNPLAPGNRVLGNYPDGIVTRPGPKTSNEQVTFNQIIIDSRDRDRTLYPKPNNYVIQLKSPIRDVVSLEMLQICIPKSEDLINDNNNQFTFQESQDQIDNGTYVTASIPNGQYQLVDELCQALTSAMNNASTTGATYTVTADPLTNLVSITVTGGTGVLGVFNSSDGTYLPGNMSSNIGFGATNVKSTSGNLTSDGVYDIDGADYVVMELEGISNCMGSSDTLDGCFAMIPLCDVLHGSIFHGRLNDVGKCYVRFNPILPRLTKLHIKFRRPDGTLYDFGGRNHNFMFELKSKFKVMDY